MQNNIGLIVIVVGGIAILIGAIVGYLVALLESRLTSALKEGREEIDPEHPDAPPAPKLDEHDVLRVTIDPALKWHLDLDGARIEPDGLTVEQRTRLVNVVVQIRPWIDGKTLPPVAPKPLDAEVDQAAAALIAASANQSVTTPLRLDPLRGARDLFKSEFVKPTLPKALSIVAMIDEVLQKNLEGSPLAGKKIRIEEGSTGEVVVFVGSIRYSGIDAVPDEAIKTIIQASIAEWNKQ